MSRSVVRRAESVTVGAVRYKAAGREWSGHTPGQQQNIRSNRGHPGGRSGKPGVRTAEYSKVRNNPGQQQSRITYNKIRNTGRPNGNSCQRRAI
ncbi:unnamed protein product [Staurois parvus]|uniref:Uncharacterized protein n=1 Tax=Staurois parvus TaxID=386267 RepID=A0ABN9DDI1_9NEOB|nr:unnamed protein product [Staurois parvus]